MNADQKPVLIEYRVAISSEFAVDKEIFEISLWKSLKTILVVSEMSNVL